MSTSTSTLRLLVRYGATMDHSDLSSSSDAAGRLVAWLRGQISGATDVRLEGFEVVDIGHSAETVLVTVVTATAGGEVRQDVVIRLHPAGTGLMPPYDLQRQVTVLRALEHTDVRVPRVLWHEPTGTVLGREFYVMERAAGEVFEQTVPAEVAGDPERVRAMAFGVVDQIAAVHLVDVAARGLDGLGDGTGYLDRELAHWESEIRRLQRGPLPGLERLVAELRDRQPAQCPRITLVHGDAKPGNVMFVGTEVTALLDWELATVGDPLSDIGWFEIMWAFPVGLPTVPGAPSIDELLERYQALTGIAVEHRAWYRALAGLKMAVINLSGAMMLDSGESDDPKFLMFGVTVPFLTQLALHEFGIDEQIDPGPVAPRQERIDEVSRRAGLT